MTSAAVPLRHKVPTAAARRMRGATRIGAGERGIALVLALWLTILLTVIASGFAFSMRSEAIAARNAITLARARVAADGAVERTLFELSRPRMVDAWTPDGQPHLWREDDATLVVTAVDESSKIDLNSANEALLKGLVTSVGGLDNDAAARVVDAIIDWRDPDDLRRPNGAESAEYRAANLKYGPANAPFESVGEVARVLGVTADLYARIAPSLTVYSRQAGINPLTASRDVLLALPAATPDLVDRYIQQRQDALASKLPVPFFPAAQSFGVGAIPVWRIRAEAQLADGVTFVREAVLRPVADVRRPLIALAWLDGARASPLPPGPESSAGQPSSNSENNARRP
jgi:general secretion pathway protein K